MWPEITSNLVEKGLLSESALKALTPPKNNQNIINTLVGANIDSIVIAKTIAATLNIKISSEIIDKNDYILDEDVLYITNPFDADAISNFIIQMNKAQLSFSEIGIAAINKSNKRASNQETKYLLTDIINTALDNNATDIRIAPRNQSTIYIRYRIDGQLINDLFDDINLVNYELLANQLLIAAEKSPGVYTESVDGQFVFKNNINIRLSMLPTDYCFENGFIIPMFVLRVHRSTNTKILEIKELNLLHFQVDLLTQLANFNQGLIYVTGPTGSGKTTLNYAFIRLIQKYKPLKAIATLEDPVEIKLAGVEQTTVNNAVTFSKGATAFMRLDSDVLLIGETRDETTAKEAINLSNTGHLTLSTLHTNNALSTINRLNDLGVSFAKISDALIAVIGIRLVRKVCQKCSKKTIINDELAKQITSYHIKLKKDIAIRSANLKGCTKCSNGYLGRTSVCEIFVIDKAAKTIIRESFSENKLIDYFNNSEQKINFFWHHGYKLLIDNITTLAELQAVLPFYNITTTKNKLDNKLITSNTTKAKKQDSKDTKNIKQAKINNKNNNTQQESWQEPRILVTNDTDNKEEQIDPNLIATLGNIFAD